MVGHSKFWLLFVLFYCKLHNRYFVKEHFPSDVEVMKAADPKAFGADWQVESGSRQKRQSSGMAGILCMMSCANELEKNVAPIVDLNSIEPYDILLSLNKQKLKAYCSDVSAARTCLGGCGDFPFRETVMAAARSSDYVCVKHYKEFMEQMPCFNKMRSKVAPCYRKCKGASFEKKFGRRKENGESALPEQCSYHSCLLKCLKPINRRLCGNTKATKLLRGQIGAVLEEMPNMSLLGAGPVLPKKCRTLIVSLDKIPLRKLYNKKVVEATRYDRPLGSSGGSAGYFLPHSGVVLTLQDGLIVLVHKGADYSEGPDDCKAVVTSVKHMSDKWKIDDGTACHRTHRLGAYVRKAGCQYKLLTDNCWNASRRMMKLCRKK